MSPGLRHPLAAIWLLAGSALAAAPGAEIDVRTGLVKAGAWEEVRAYCGACHSLDLVTSQQNSVEGWQEIVRSMRRSHNMVELPTQTEARIVDYLTRHFAPEARGHRRAPIPGRLMPRLRVVAAAGTDNGLRPTAETWRREGCEPVPRDVP